MSERAAPLLGLVEAFNEGGVEAALVYFDPEIEWWAPPEWLEDRVYEGHDGLRRLAAQWTQLFDQYRLEPETVIDVGDDEVVLLLHQHGQIVGSGDPVEGPLGYLALIRDGLVARLEVHFSWEGALDAAGIAG
jgi:ketosteroid isomerase-like protein